jgi:signal transduction histidine kinase
MNALHNALGSEQLLEQLPACTWLLDRNLEIQALFGNSEHVFGLPTGQLRGRNFGEIVEPERRSYWIDRVARVLRGERLCLHKPLASAMPVCSICLFPVRSLEGEVTLAGGLAQLADDRHLAARIVQAQEMERARLARLLHDHAGQYLTAAGLQLDLLHLDLEENAIPQAARTAEIQRSLELVMEAVRDLGHQLSPTGVERTGLGMALDGLARRLRSDFHGIVRVLAEPAALPPPTAAAALYRIAEEAAVNAARHSGGTTIEILLKSSRQGLALEIRDNGHGFPPGDGVSSGLGLVIMEQYAEQAGLDLHIDSRPGQGTVVKALCRLAHEATAG